MSRGDIQDYDRRLARHFGARIKELREDKGLSQGQLATRTGLVRSHLSLIEQGKCKVFLETAKVISKGLQVSLGELIDDL